VRAAGLYILAALFASSALAAEVCPPACIPKSPTCAERIARAKAHGCVVAPEPVVKIVDHQVVVPCPDRVVTREVQVAVPTPGPERIVTKTVTITAPPKGHALLGGGPIYSRAGGLTAVAGYQWPNGWMLLGGPTWIPLDPIHGSTTGCVDGNDKKGWCYPITLPYTASPGSQWGAQMLVIHAF